MRWFFIVFHFLLTVGLAAESTSPPTEHEPVTVSAGFHLLNIGEIDEASQSCEVTGYLHLAWQDDRLAFDETMQGATEKSFLETAALKKRELIWWPAIEIANQIGAAETRNVQLVIKSDGHVEYDAKLTARIAAPLDLRKFPFDRQQIELHLESFAFHVGQVVFAVDETSTGQEQINLAQWEVGDAAASADIKSGEIAGQRYARVTVTYPLQRNSWYYVWQVVFPLVLAVGISWTIFWINVSSFEYSRRVSLVITCLLTLIALRFAVNKDMPKIPYLTGIDYIFLISYAFLAFAAIQSIVVKVISEKDLARSLQIDHTCRWAFPLAYYVAIGISQIAVRISPA